MQKEQLIGRWKREGRPVSWIDLRADGTAVCETRLGGDDEMVSDEVTCDYTWDYVDATHWNLTSIIPPRPDLLGLEEGATEVSEYEVISFTAQRMELTLFDYDLPIVYLRV